MKILLAEDDLVTSEIIKAHLQQWGYDVICKYNGMDAWEALQGEDAPKLVVLDWQIPVFSGIEICRKLRNLKKGSYVYVVMLTSLTDKSHVVQGLEAGADDYLTKPCNPHELKVRLSAGQRILGLESELLSALTQLKESVSNNVYDTQLTGREMDILRLVATGKNDDEVARTFHMSPDWVLAYMSTIIQKLNVHSREEVVQKAIRDNILGHNIVL
jgi:DNA-binding response OmpR family regulator